MKTLLHGAIDGVEFNGLDRIIWGKDDKIKVQFIVDYDVKNFEVYAITINERKLTAQSFGIITEMAFQS